MLIDPKEMYNRAKSFRLANQSHPLLFYQFHEWIIKDLAQTLYCMDVNFKSKDNQIKEKNTTNEFTLK